MENAVRCRDCGRELPWFITLKVSGILCRSCLKVWHEGVRDEVPV